MYTYILTAVSCLQVLQFTCALICNNPPPGLNKMKRGVDITKLDLVPLDFTRGDGFQRPIIDFTCNEKKTWTNRRKETFDMPDQVWDITKYPGGWLNNKVNIIKTYNEMQRSMAADAGVGLTFSKGMFSSSGSYKKVQNTITNSSRYVEEVSAFDSAIKADILPPFGLNMSRYTKLFVDKLLPATFKENPSRYFQFIRYFGTHFFQSGHFGGLIRLHIETSSDYYKGRTERQVKAQAEASFLKILKAKGGYSGNTVTIDQKFTSMSSTDVRYFGGDTNLMIQNGLTTWQPTVISNPWMFSGQLEPISELIGNPQKRKSMVKAVTIYINKAYLKELQRLLLGAKSRYNNGRSRIDALLGRVKAAIAAVEPSQTVVDALGREVETDFVAPEWFTLKTKLCYRWYPDGDGGQCGGGVGRNLCAKPNAMTQYYRDDTDRRGGGCQMSWGIIPETLDRPSWFNSVQICYRWYPDGDGGQCGGGAARLLCASVGRYTPYYRDDSDRRSGGCRMSWQLKVPNNAPVWMHNVQLCYYWYPDGDGGQCGGGNGLSRQLCATTGQWTPYYRDDTDRRGGGCRMSWGIKF